MTSAKAYVAALIAGLAFLAPAVDNGLTVGEGLGALVAALVAFQGVYWTTNRDPGSDG